MSSYRDLTIWKRSFDLCADIYSLTKKFPKEENYGLTSQIRRASVSLPSNLSEGSKRGTKEFIHFLKIAHGSGAELETQLLLTERLGYATSKDLENIVRNLTEVMGMIGALIKKLAASTSNL